jgi:type I restriction enzyme M protein
VEQTDLGDRLLAFAKVLGDGEEVTTLDFAEQLSLLVFLKLAAEHTELSGQNVLPLGYCWADIADKDGDPLETKYGEILHSLSALDGQVGAFFARAVNRIRQPALLRRVIVELMGSVNWTGLDVEIKGPAFERL